MRLASGDEFRSQGIFKISSPSIRIRVSSARNRFPSQQIDTTLGFGTIVERFLQNTGEAISTTWYKTGCNSVAKLRHLIATTFPVGLSAKASCRIFESRSCRPGIHAA